MLRRRLVWQPSATKINASLCRPSCKRSAFHKPPWHEFDVLYRCMSAMSCPTRYSPMHASVCLRDSMFCTNHAADDSPLDKYCQFDIRGGCRQKEHCRRHRCQRHGQWQGRIRRSAQPACMRRLPRSCAPGWRAASQRRSAEPRGMQTHMLE